MDQLKRMGDFMCDLVKISIFAMKYQYPKQLGEENVYWLTLLHCHERKAGIPEGQGFEAETGSETIEGCCLLTFSTWLTTQPAFL